MSGSAFSHVSVTPPIAAFHLTEKYKVDKFPKKVNLTIGAYRDDQGLPWVLPVVRTVEAQMANDPTLNHEYLPLDGLKAFTEASVRLLLGQDSPAITQNRVCAVQAVSGTGAIRLGFDFLFKFYPVKTVYISCPTWGNHSGILKAVGYTDIREYSYYNKQTRGLDFEGMMEDLRKAPEGSVVILHTCAHNPTGNDPTKDEWKQILELMKERRMVPFFDTAYQGFATGDPDTDGWPVREFVRQGFEVFAAQSFSKNFGLYNERVGNLCCVLSSSEVVEPIRTQLVAIGRATWSNCPNHGARIVATTLNNPSYYQEWLENVAAMADRMRLMREELYKLLKARGTPGSWEHVLKQIGMFAYTGLTATQAEYLLSQYHIYLLKSGRISVCGLNSKNLEYVVDAIHDAVTKYPENSA